MPVDSFYLTHESSSAGKALFYMLVNLRSHVGRGVRSSDSLIRSWPLCRLCRGVSARCCYLVLLLIFVGRFWLEHSPISSQNSCRHYIRVASYFLVKFIKKRMVTAYMACFVLDDRYKRLLAWYVSATFHLKFSTADTRSNTSRHFYALKSASFFLYLY